MWFQCDSSVVMAIDPPVDLHLLFETHGAFVSRLARAMVSEEHTAEDLAHETWAAVVDRPPSGVRNVRAWLSTILQRRVVAHRRRSRRSVAIEFAEPIGAVSGAATADEAAQQLEAENMLQTAVRALDEPYQSAIYLRFHEGLPPRAIAARMGVPVSTVKTRLSRGLDRLRAALDRQEGESATPEKNWRLALAPVAGLHTAAIELSSTAPLSGATPSLLLGMKKLIVAAAALLLFVGLYARYSSPDDPREVTGLGASDDTASADLVDVEDELSVPATSVLARGQADEDAGALPTNDVEGRSETVLVVEVKGPNGAAIVGRSILLKASPWLNDGQPPFFRRTDGSGRVVFSRLKALNYIVQDAHGEAEDWLDLEAGETRTLRWTIEDDVVIKGLVLDGLGKPVPGADVWSARSAEVGKAVWPIGTAGPGGRFVVHVSTAVGLQATAGGRLPSSLYAVKTLLEVSAGVRELELIVGPLGSSMAGRVVDAAGQPVAGAQVVVQVSQPIGVLSAENGWFQHPSALPVGDHAVTVRAAGYAPTVKTVRVAATPLEVEFVLRRGVKVSGTVLSPDGTPAAKAHVWVASPASRWQALGHGQGPSARCDEEGRYTLRQVAPGPVALRAQAGWADVTSQAELLLEVTESDERGRHLQLDFGRTIAGRVVDHEGLFISGMVVTAFSGSVRSKDARTGPDGYFSLSALPEPEDGPDEWELVSRLWTGTSVRVLGRLSGVRPNSDDVEFVVGRTQEASATIVGRIAADTSPIPGDVQAMLGDQGGRGGSALPFDPDTGAFAKGPLRPGTYRLELVRGGVSVATKSGLVVGVGETLDAGVIRVNGGGSVEVRPMLPSAPPLPLDQLNVILRDADASLVGPGQQQSTLDWSEGAWRSRGSLEPGAWRLTVLAEGLVMPSQSITVEPGKTVRTELSVSPGRRVAVQVEMPIEDPWSELQVAIRDASGRLLYDGGTVTRADLDHPSRITVERTLPMGPVRILVSTDTGVSADTSVVIPPREEPFSTVSVVAR